MSILITNETIRKMYEELKKRVEEKILEKNNFDFLTKLLEKAESEDEAIGICRLGTTFYKTGLRYDTKMEKPSDGLKHFVKNDKLSFGSDYNSNTLILGDNYDALLNLQIAYKNKIDVIYIDPPYGKDSMGEFANTNYENAITRDNLLSMLFSRLLLAKQLMKNEDSLIFCSIDERNYAYIKCLFDDIFGERNYVATFDWMKTATPPSLSKNVRKKFEYVICYKKDILTKPLCGGVVSGGDMPLLNDGNKVIGVKVPKDSIIVKIPNGKYEMGVYDRVELLEDFIVENGVALTDLFIKGPMKWTQDTINEEVAANTKFFIKSEKFAIRYAREGERIKTPSNIITKEECNVGTNEDGAKDLLEIFDKKMFDYPKPVSLIKYLINMITYDKKDAVILDFYAGSGTTGQAVLDLNKEDKGNRKFILVQLPEYLELDSDNPTVKNQIELLDEYSLPHNLGYITIDRLRRIMIGKKYNNTTDIKWLKKNVPYNSSLQVLDLVEDSIYDITLIDKIDETLYGKEKFENIKDKIEWVCSNFEKVARRLTDVTRD